MRADFDIMKGWLKHMHRTPELSMQEENTAKYIEDTLGSFGEYEIETGIGRYGIVASLKMCDGDQVIGLRAEFEALPIQEANDLEYRSQTPGFAHLCAHDGHTAMLMAAAKYLAMALQTIVAGNIVP